MSTALLASLRASCRRGQVGCALVRDNRIIATSYNGSLPSSTHCNDTCDLNISCKKTLHAEQNLIAFCAKQGIKTMDTILYITMSPCYSCSKVLVQAGIKEVVYLKEFRENLGLTLLEKHGIKLTKYDEQKQGNIPSLYL